MSDHQFKEIMDVVWFFLMWGSVLTFWLIFFKDDHK